MDESVIKEASIHNPNKELKAWMDSASVWKKDSGTSGNIYGLRTNQSWTQHLTKSGIWTKWKHEQCLKQQVAPFQNSQAYIKSSSLKSEKCMEEHLCEHECT